MNVSTRIRPAAVAGRFYPDDARKLEKDVSAMIKVVPPHPGPSPKAIIAPHAGYIYSGPVAASAFARFAADREVIKRVVLLGPSHRVALTGLATSSATAFRTPLGEIPVDTAAVRALASIPGVTLLDAAHAQEHALEVELPFLQVVLDEFSIVPIVTGDAAPELVAEVLESLWGGEETRFVISSDLSHYYEWQSARRLDKLTAKAIESLTPDAITEEQACGRVAIRGMLLAARRHGLQGGTIDLRNSGDTAGPRNQVVGYGAFEFCRQIK